MLLSLIVLTTLAIYVPNIPSTLLNIDLPAYNHVLYSTDYAQTILHLFSDFSGRIVTGYYAPLGSVSLMLDKSVAGSQTPVPLATFLINIILHTLNGILLYFLMRVFRVPPWAAITAIC